MNDDMEEIKLTLDLETAVMSSAAAADADAYAVRQYVQQDALSMSNLQRAFGGLTGINWNAAQATGTQAKPVARITEQLLWNGKPLPRDWAGAKITGYGRSIEGEYWELRFTSPWGFPGITAYFSTYGYSGSQVDAAGDNFVMILNQMRVS